MRQYYKPAGKLAEEICHAAKGVSQVLVLVRRQKWKGLNL